MSHFDLAVRPGDASGSSKQVARIHLVDGHAQWLHGLEELSDPEMPLHWPLRRVDAETAPVDLDSQLGVLNEIVADLRRERTQREAG